MLVALNICLVIVLAGVLVYGLSRQTAGVPFSEANQLENDDFVGSDFVVEETSCDINPGRQFVLYTNFACPYCKLFYERCRDVSYTTRFLILDKEGPFATQETVLGFMLKLYRYDESVYRDMEELLFANQEAWTDLSDEKVLAFLNEQSGQSWTGEDFAAEIGELRTASEEAPSDLEYVPALFADGRQYKGLVERLVEN